MTPIRPPAVRRRRRLIELLATVCVVLIPWTLHLATSLPHQYTTRHWNALWAGFDTMLLAALAATTAAGLKRRHITIPLMVVSSTLLVCDAWFDIMTSWDTADFPAALASALLLELPLAAFLLRSARHLLLASIHAAAHRGWKPARDVALHRLPLAPTHQP
ncbi:hypothetical protein GCM10009760_63330 [Kitasatospora kazusensis]|uniref:Uncharacterized protein n=1 Tax=Kitasatospora kazusensis TaxID=407974 RepID=A0ABP4KEJ9_9ACTN